MHLASVTESYRELEEKNGELQEAYDRLKELDRLKSNFLATVSHELRTPLTSIIGYSEMLREGIAGDLRTSSASSSSTIHEKGEQLLPLIMSLLDLSKLESGTLQHEAQAIAIDHRARRGRHDDLPTARKKGVNIELEAGRPARRAPRRSRAPASGVHQPVRQRAKFTPKGGTVTIRARTVQGSDGAGDDDEDGFALMAPAQAKLEVRVIDTGIGIPPKERQKVFDAFYQVDSSSTREYGGTGLGLSIVKRIVEAHGGTIGIEENQPQGAVFVVTLPSSTGANGKSVPPSRAVESASRTDALRARSR